MFDDDVVHGQARLDKLIGGRYVGAYCMGQKHGHGEEEFGNFDQVTYECPAGHRHVRILSFIIF